MIFIVLHKRHIGLETTPNMLRLQAVIPNRCDFLSPNVIFVIVDTAI